MTRVILGLGSNIGGRRENLLTAIKHLKATFSITDISSIYSSHSLLEDSQEDYYNIVCSCFTELSGEEVLEKTQQIEKDMGRLKNTGRWGARIIDIDILDFGGLIIKKQNLETPHSGIALRSFVLYPLMEIIPDYVHPVSGRSVVEMVALLKNDLEIKPVAKFSL